MKDTVSHYVPPHSPLTSTEPQVFSNNLTMPSGSALLLCDLDVLEPHRGYGEPLLQGSLTNHCQ